MSTQTFGDPAHRPKSEPCPHRRDRRSGACPPGDPPDIRPRIGDTSTAGYARYEMNVRGQGPASNPGRLSPCQRGEHDGALDTVLRYLDSSDIGADLLEHEP